MGSLGLWPTLPLPPRPQRQEHPHDCPENPCCGGRQSYGYAGDADWHRESENSLDGDGTPSGRHEQADPKRLDLPVFVLMLFHNIRILEQRRNAQSSVCHIAFLCTTSTFCASRAFCAKHHKRIEGNLTQQWDWDDSDQEMMFLRAEMEGFIDDSEERLDEIRAWMPKNLSELKEVLDPELQKIRAAGWLSSSAQTDAQQHEEKTASDSE